MHHVSYEVQAAHSLHVLLNLLLLSFCMTSLEHAHPTQGYARCNYCLVARHSRFDYPDSTNTAGMLDF